MLVAHHLQSFRAPAMLDEGRHPNDPQLNPLFFDRCQFHLTSGVVRNHLLCLSHYILPVALVVCRLLRCDTYRSIHGRRHRIMLSGGRLGTGHDGCWLFAGVFPTEVCHV